MAGTWFLERENTASLIINTLSTVIVNTSDIQNPPVSLQEYQNSTSAELEKLSHFVGMLIPPYSTCVILGAGNDRITLVVEGTGEYLIRMTF